MCGPDAQGVTGDILDHQLWVAATHYLPVDARLIPEGHLEPVAGTPFDFSRPRRLRSALGLDLAQLSLGGGGLDHCFVLNPAGEAGASPVAKLTSTDASMCMHLFTSYPGLQCYSGNYLAGLPGRDGRDMVRHAGMALEPEYFPDSSHHGDWPQTSCWQTPGVARSHFIRYEFHRGGMTGR